MGNSTIWACGVLFSIPALSRADFGSHPTSFLHSKQSRFLNHQQKLSLPSWHHRGYFLSDDKKPSKPLMVFPQPEWYLSVNYCSTHFLREVSHIQLDKIRWCMDLYWYCAVIIHNAALLPSCFCKQNPPTLCYTSVSQSDSSRVHVIRGIIVQMSRQLKRKDLKKGSTCTEMWNISQRSAYKIRKWFMCP